MMLTQKKQRVGNFLHLQTTVQQQNFQKTIREMFRRSDCRFRQQTETAPKVEKPSPNLTVFLHNIVPSAHKTFRLVDSEY
jgi:hypothetical protein